MGGSLILAHGGTAGLMLEIGVIVVPLAIVLLVMTRYSRRGRDEDDSG
jgi:hypothetical protein